MTLALLLTAVTGAWADEPKVYDSGDVELFSLQVGDILMPGVTLKNSDVNNIADANIISNRYSIDGVISPYGGNAISSIPFSIGENGLLTAKLAGNGPYDCMPITEDGKAGNAWVVTDIFAEPNYKTILIGGTMYPAPSGPEVAWNAETKTGTFTMPGSDVVLTPIYAKAAAFATTGTEPDVKTLLPEAAEGVIADTDAPLIKEGTGIVAFAGTSTEVKQGTLMYTVTPATVTEAPPLDAANKWSADVPTAKTVADGGIDVLVWYYIKGADTPDGVAATLDNTFNDTEPACLTVQVLSNKFDIQFNAANANTIEAGKATVTVGGAAATVTEGKLQGVKMGSEVKVKANTGYKFRKVEVKKKEAEAYPLLSAATTSDQGKVVCAAGHLHDAKTAVPDGCTAVGILGKVTETGHGLILALQDATAQTWNTINGWTSETTYAGTTLKVLPDAARGSLASYTTLGETAVSNWAVAQKSDYEAIFTNLGSTVDDGDGMTYDGKVNAYITTGVGGTEISGKYWSATMVDGTNARDFDSTCWYGHNKGETHSVRPVLGF